VGSRRGGNSAPRDGRARDKGLSPGCWLGIGLAAALVALLLVGLARGRSAAVVEALAQVHAEDTEREAKRIAAAVEAYRCDTGRLPETLDELTKAKDGGEPYLTEMPVNPSDSEAGWSYDPVSGSITDPSGSWGGSALPHAASAVGGTLDQGKLPPVHGRLWGTDDLHDFTPSPPREGRKWLAVYLFRKNDSSVRADVAMLVRTLPSDVEAVGILLPPAAADSAQRALEPEDLDRTLPVLDARGGATEIVRSARIDQTPLLLLCDRDLRVRARSGGALAEDTITKLLAEIDEFDRALRLGS
jgi:hypothetical protein